MTRLIVSEMFLQSLQDYPDLVELDERTISVETTHFDKNEQSHEDAIEEKIWHLFGVPIYVSPAMKYGLMFEMKSGQIVGLNNT